MNTIQITLEATDRLLLQLEVEDNAIACDLASVHRCLQLSLATIAEVNEAILQYGFPDTTTEIAFFKQHRPVLDGRQFYYAQLVRILSTLPGNSRVDKESLFRKEMHRIRQFFADHREMALYHELDLKHSDQLYYTRGASFAIIQGQLFVGDTRISATRSQEIAAIYGYRLLQTFLDTDLFYDGQQHNAHQSTEAAITWTGTIAGLTELIYGLNEMGVFNGKKMEIVRLSVFFEKVFNIQIGNIYKAHETNRIRKKARTPFIDNLRMALIRRYEHDDEFSRG